MVSSGFFSSEDRPAIASEDNEAYIGNQIATLAIGSTQKDEEVTLLFLYGKHNKHYAPRGDALRESLVSENRSVNELWAVDEGIYNDDDYTKALNRTLTEYPDTKALVIVAAGGVTHAKISRVLQNFLKRKGKLIMIGQSLQDAALTELAEKGRALLIARRRGWLKPEIKAATDTPKSYFKQEYMLLGNI